MKHVPSPHVRRIIYACASRRTLSLVVLICAGLSLLSFSLHHPAQPMNQQSAPTATPASHSKPFSLTCWTSDKQFQVTLNTSPNQYGTNVFTVIVWDQHKAPVPANTIQVALFLSNLDMDMGTEQVPLQPDSNGNFSAVGNLSMDGNWQAHVVVQTVEAKLLFHNATLTFFTPA